jgi:hypothetical protein
MRELRLQHYAVQGGFLLSLSTHKVSRQGKKNTSFLSLGPDPTCRGEGACLQQTMSPPHQTTRAQSFAPLHPKDGRSNPTPLASSIDSPWRDLVAQLRKASHFLRHLALLVAPEALSRPATAPKFAGIAPARLGAPWRPASLPVFRGAAPSTPSRLRIPAFSSRTQSLFQFHFRTQSRSKPLEISFD